MSNQDFKKAKKMTLTMIALFLALSLLLPASSTQALPQKAQPAYSGTYCTSTHTATYQNEYISRVQLYSGDQSSNRNANGYQDYTGLGEFAKLYQGSTYLNTIQVTGTEPSTFTLDNRVKVWVDFNQNGIFNNTDEEFDLGNYTFTGNHVFSKNLIVPTGALTGLTRMRVMLLFGQLPTSCSNYQFGETEDYTIKVESMPDLIVSKVILTPAYIHDFDKSFQIDVTVKNQGGSGMGTSSSDTRLYISPISIPSSCPTVNDIAYTVSWPTADLLPEEEETYTYIVSDGELIAGPHQMYAYADANCSLNEGFENNNSYAFDGVPRLYLPLLMK